MFCQFNYSHKYCWKSIVKSIFFSFIAWCGLVESGLESSLNPRLNSKGKGLSRVWTQAYNWPIRESVLDPYPCLPWTHKYLQSLIVVLERVERQENGSKSSPWAGKRPNSSLPISWPVQWGERSGYLWIYYWEDIFRHWPWSLDRRGFSLFYELSK